MDKIDQIFDHVVQAVGNTIRESTAMLQQKFDATEQEVAAAIGLALARLACASTAEIALGSKATERQRLDLCDSLAARISPILLAARGRSDV